LGQTYKKSVVGHDPLPKNPPLRNQGWVLLKRKPTIISALGRKLLIDVFELSKIKQADNVKTDFENMIG